MASRNKVGNRLDIGPYSDIYYCCTRTCVRQRSSTRYSVSAPIDNFPPSVRLAVFAGRVHFTVGPTKVVRPETNDSATTARRRNRASNGPDETRPTSNRIGFSCENRFFPFVSCTHGRKYTLCIARFTWPGRNRSRCASEESGGRVVGRDQQAGALIIPVQSSSSSFVLPDTMCVCVSAASLSLSLPRHLFPYSPLTLSHSPPPHSRSEMARSTGGGESARVLHTGYSTRITARTYVLIVISAPYRLEGPVRVPVG